MQLHKNQQEQLEPFARIQRAGFDIRVRFAEGGNHWSFALTRDGVAIAHRVSSRSGNLCVAEAEARARAGEFGPTSSAHSALEQLADVAENALLDPRQYDAMCEHLRALKDAGQSVRASK